MFLFVYIYNTGDSFHECLNLFYNSFWPIRIKNSTVFFKKKNDKKKKNTQTNLSYTVWLLLMEPYSCAVFIWSFITRRLRWQCSVNIRLAWTNMYADCHSYIPVWLHGMKRDIPVKIIDT